MSQSDYNVANADGATVRADINSQLDAIGSQNSGSTAPPVVFPYMRWFDTANSLLMERNGANTAWRTVAAVVAGELVPYAEGFPLTAWDGLKWLAQPIGVPFGVRDDLAGADVPPTDNTNYRYIKLTAGEDGSGQYNEGALTSESISGSAPLVVATAVIDYASSPIHGATVNLWNTEGRYGKPGMSPGSVANDQMQKITGKFDSLFRADFFSGAFTYLSKGQAIGIAGSSNNYGDILFDSANSPGARTGTYTDVKHQELTYYMRIA